MIIILLFYFQGELSKYFIYKPFFPTWCVGLTLFPIPPVHNSRASPIIARCQIILPQALPYLQQAAKLLKLAADPTTTQAQERTYSKQISDLFPLLHHKLATLTRLHDQWSSILWNLSPKEAPYERDLYSQLTADFNGLFQTIINIQDKLKQLELRVSTLPTNTANSSILQSSVSSTNPLIRN